MLKLFMIGIKINQPVCHYRGVPTHVETVYDRKSK